MIAHPDGGLGGAGMNAFAAAARAAAEKAKALNPPSPIPPCDGCKTRDSRYTHLEEQMSKANATIDDQAATIVSLRASAQLGAPVSRDTDTIQALQRRELDQRFNLDRAEARARQLEDWARSHDLITPVEAAYFRGDKSGEPKF